MSVASLGSREVRSFFAALATFAGMDWVSKLAMRFSSDQASETYKWLSAAPALREWVGARMAKGLKDNGITIANKTFEATLEFLSDDLRRDKTDQIDVRIQDLSRRYLGHKRALLSTLILNGAGTTSGSAYDGKSYFDDDHAEGSSGTLINVLAAAQVGALNVGTPTAPTSYEAALAILGVISHMMTFLDDQGQPIHDDAQEFLVMVGPSLMPAFTAAANLRTANTGSGTVDNPLVQNPDLRISVAVNPRLSSWTDAFAVFRTDAPTKPFILQEEEGLTIQTIGAGSEYETINNKQIFGVKEIGNVGYGMWQHAAKATLS